MFGWFRKKPARLEPESKWVVDANDSFIRVTDHAGVMTELSKGDLSGVAIETNDTGPWGAVLWWLLFGTGDHMVCAFPQGATGEAALIDFLSALPAFDHGEMIKAMASTENAIFPVWRRSA